MNKGQREECLIEIYQKLIQPRLNSPNFPVLSREEILKVEAKRKYRQLFEQSKETMTEQEFRKRHGDAPESLISQMGWFLISDAKQKDVSNMHYSFGFEDGEKEFWVEIALNSVASVEQFLSMNEKEIKRFFELSKTKPSKMLLTLTKKTKTNFAGSATHEMIFKKEMCKLTEQDIGIVRKQANEINNLRDALIKPFIGLCVVSYVKNGEIGENFAQMEDVFEFIKTLMPRKSRYKNTMREEKQLEKRKNEIEQELPMKRKYADFMKNLGRFEDQEKIEKIIMTLEQELLEINTSIEEKNEIIVAIERDMGGKIR